MQGVSPGRRRCCLMRTWRASGAVRGRLSIGRPSRAICPFPSFFPAASRRKTWDARSAKCGPGPWMCRAAWKRAAGSRTPRRSSNSFGACDLKMQGNPPDWAQYALPDARGHFGPYGGVFVAETLRGALDELTLAYSACREDPEFQGELAWELEHYVGRPSPIFHARRLSEETGGAQIYLKREDLNHTGAHKVNNTVGQAMLARRMGKPRVIAETGAGQHGGAAATVAARYGMEWVVYMGTQDGRRAAWVSRPASTRRRSRRARPACCTATAPISCRTRTGRSRKPIRSPPASTIPAWAPSTPGSRTPAARNTSRSPTTRRSRPSMRS